MKSNGLDQFYTHPDLAEEYAGKVSDIWGNADTLFIEPSAGSGSFFTPLRNAGCKIRGMDLDPKIKEIKKGDFLDEHHLFAGNHDIIIVIGNPPFGKNSSLAVKFFNKAAKHADVIAFIVPRTFGKDSVHRRLDPYFHLVKNENVPKNSFILNGNPHDVPCFWQIWERRENTRKIPELPDVNNLISYTTPEKADFAMRRVGYYAGRILDGEILSLSKTTHYFIQEHKKGVKRWLKKFNWTPIVSRTAGVRSLSKSEICKRAVFSVVNCSFISVFSLVNFTICLVEVSNLIVFANKLTGLSRNLIVFADKLTGLSHNLIGLCRNPGQ